MQSLGTFFLRTKTCTVPKYFGKGTRNNNNNTMTGSLNCWDLNSGNDGTDMLIMASAAKSGAVLSARIVAEVGSACGYCVASGERSRAGIPGPIEELPTYDGLMLHAIINMRQWPKYVQSQGFVPSIPKENKHVRCVTTLRDPLSRLRSLYLYARSGGESWFRYESGIMQKLIQISRNESLTESLKYFWNHFGKEYLIQSHEYMMMNLNRGCVGIKMEDLKRNYDENIHKLLDVWGVKKEIIPILIKRLESSDLSRKTKTQKESDPHITSNKFSKQLVSNVVRILENMAEVKQMLEEHRIELGYL